MGAEAVKTSLVRVICVGCSQNPDAECEICHGARYHLWDPQSFLCYTPDGTPLTVKDDLGNLVHVSKNPEFNQQKSNLAVEAMLGAIELWVSESPVRKWRLTLDEEGWHACVWFNRYKKTCFDTSDTRLDLCVERSFREIFTNPRTCDAD
jgi:hypothetical protein